LKNRQRFKLSILETFHHTYILFKFSLRQKRNNGAGWVVVDVANRGSSLSFLKR